MKTKQIIGIIVTGLVIIAVGITGVLSNVFSSQFTGGTDSFSFLTDFFEEDAVEEEAYPEEPFVGVIDIVGEISGVSDYYSTGTYNHSLYMDYIDSLMETEYNEGILLYVDTPGGNVYESDELYLKLMEYKEETGRPIWAYFASEACSGGYYISMAADKIYANRNCWTGSIGVIVSLMNAEGLYEKLGLEEINIASGDNKAMGSMGEELTQEQYDILQSLVDEAYDQFVDIVCEGRELSEETVRELADGRIYSAKQALEVDLIDGICLQEEMKDLFVKEEKLSEDVIFHTPEGEMESFDWLTEYLFFAAEKLQPKTDAEIATDILENDGNGVLRYYAE